jgi:hypothetical protein
VALVPTHGNVNSRRRSPGNKKTPRDKFGAR